jgi:hypothetical protein
LHDEKTAKDPEECSAWIQSLQILAEEVDDSYCSIFAESEKKAELGCSQDVS